MLCPGDPGHNISIIDVRDLADFVVSAVERGITDAFDAAGGTAATTMGALIDACVRAGGGIARPIWADEPFLKADDVTPLAELPAWLPDGEDSLMWASSANAVAAGPTYRPLDDTVTATLDFTRAKGLDRPLKSRARSGPRGSASRGLALAYDAAWRTLKILDGTQLRW